MRLTTLLAGSTVLAALCGIAAPASAGVLTAPILDQQQEQRNGGGHVATGREVAQTFVPSFTGRLVSVDVSVDWWNFSEHQLHLRVARTVDGKPDAGGVMGGAPVPTQRGWSAVSLGGSDVQLEAGNTYALWLTSDDPTLDDTGIGVEVNWRPDAYPAGQALALRPGEDWKPWKIDVRDGPTADLKFRTYMEVPEPGTAAFAGAAAAALLLRRGRRG